jgi:gluconolactonase
MRVFSRRFALAALAFFASGSRAEELSKIIAPGAQVEKIAQGFRYLEGPAWDARGWLLFSDIPADIIYKWVPGARARRGSVRLPASLVGSLQVFRRPSGHSNGLALDRQNRLIACEHDRRISRTEADGTIVTLADRFENKRLNSPNDLVVKRDGSIYFTDPPYGIANDKDRELPFSGIFRITVDGKLSLLEKGVPFPNGLAFSPDETRLYVVDSEANQIHVFDVAADGSLGKSRLFAEVKLAGSRDGPDGIKVDSRGNVFSAGPDGVWVFAPDGQLLGKISTPETPANLTFGGIDRSTLYITARTGLYRIRLKTAAP